MSSIKVVKTKIGIFGLSLVAPVTVVVEDVATGQYFNASTGAYDSAVPVYNGMTLHATLGGFYEFDDSNWVHLSGYKRIFIIDGNALQDAICMNVEYGMGSDNASIAEMLHQVQNSVAARQQYMSLGALLGIAASDIIGFAVYTANDQPAVCTASALRLVERTNAAPPFTNSWSFNFTSAEARPGWVFTAYTIQGDRKSGEALYLLGTTTDGVTTENALLIMGSDLSITYVTGDWGLVASPGEAHLVRYRTANQVLTIVKSGTSVNLHKWDATTGAYIGGTTLIDGDVANLKTSVFGIDDDNIYMVIRRVSTAALYKLLKISMTTPATFTEINLNTIVADYGPPNCTMLQVIAGMVFVGTDAGGSSGISVVAVFDTDLGLQHLFPQGGGEGIDVYQGIAEGPYHLYSYCGSRGRINIIDKYFGTRVKSVRLPDAAWWQAVIAEGGEFVCVVYASGGIYFISRDANGVPYITWMPIDYDGHQALAEMDASISALPSSLVVSLESAGVMQNLITVQDGSPLETVQSNVKPISFAFGASWASAGSRIFFTAKADPEADNSTAVINRECTITDDATMTGSITPTALETAAKGSYYAEFNRFDADGVSNRVTIWQGKWNVVQKVRS